MKQSQGFFFFFSSPHCPWPARAGALCDWKRAGCLGRAGDEWPLSSAARDPVYPLPFPEPLPFAGHQSLLGLPTVNKPTGAEPELDLLVPDEKTKQNSSFLSVFLNHIKNLLEIR